MITRNHGTTLLPEAYLYGKKLISDWETFLEVQQPVPTGLSNPCHPVPRLPNLAVGQLVDCDGLVSSGQGTTTSALAVPLVAIVRRRVRPGKKHAINKAGKVKLPQWRSYAVVGLRGGPNLRL